MAESMYEHIMNDFNLRPQQIKEHLEKVHHIRARQARKGYERELWSSQHEFAHKNPEWEYKADEIIKETQMTDTFRAGDLVQVEFFDSMTMKNRSEQGVVVWVRTDREIEVEVEKPIRKRVTVPIEYVHKVKNVIVSPPSTGGWHVEGHKWVRD